MSTRAPKAKNMSKTALTESTPITVVKDCIITNKAPIDVIVLDACSADTSPTQEIFQETLKVLPPEDKSSYIKANGSGNVLLDDQHKNDNGEEVDTTAYQLVIAKADCLYPVKATHSTRAHDSTKGIYYYPGVTIEVDDYTNMKSAEQFLQNIMAYPSYDLAEGFADACSQAKDAANTDTTDYVANFFAGTINYQKVKLNMLTAVTTYYDQFPYVWASYQGGKTYYLYSASDGIVAYEGSLQVTVPGVIPASSDKALPGFSITFTDPKNVDMKIFFRKGKFIDTITEDVPSICLFGSFSLKSDLTNVATDKNLISVIVGRVGKKEVIGFDEKQKETVVKDPDSGDTSKKWSGTYDLLHVDSVGKAINLLMVGGGLFMTFKEIYGGLKKLNENRLKRKAAKEAKGDDSPLTEEDFVQINTDQQRYLNDQQQGSQQEMAKVDPSIQVPKPEDMKAMMDACSKQITDQVNDKLKQTLQDGLDAQLDMFNKILDITHPRSLDAVKDRMDANQDKLDSATTPEACATVLPDVVQQLGQTNVDLKANYDVAVKKAEGDQKDGLTDAKAAADQKVEVSHNIEESRQRATEETPPEDFDFPFKEFDPTIFN